MTGPDTDRIKEAHTNTSMITTICVTTSCGWWVKNARTNTEILTPSSASTQTCDYNPQPTHQNFVFFTIITKDTRARARALL